MGVKLSHIAYFLAQKMVTNEDLEKQFPEYSSEQIYKRTGINKRFHTTRDIIGSDLAFAAAEKLFSESGIDKNVVEFLIFVTEGLDCVAPASAIILQDRLCLPTNIGAIDVPLGCSGFTHSLGLASTLINSGQVKNVMILLGDTPSLVSHPKDFPLVGLFSDAGAAVWVEETKEESVGKFVYGTDGSGAKSLSVEGGLFRRPIDGKWLNQYKDVGGMQTGRMQMDGLDVLTFSLQTVPNLVEDILIKNEITFEEIDFFVFHQASNIILKSLQRKMKIPDEKMVYCIADYGNTVSISIPIALKELGNGSKIFPGANVLIAGFGIGFSWSGTIIQY